MTRAGRYVSRGYQKFHAERQHLEMWRRSHRRSAGQAPPGLAAAGSRVTGLTGRFSPSGPPATWSATKAPRSPIGRGLPAVVSFAVCNSSSALISAPSRTM